MAEGRVKIRSWPWLALLLVGACLAPVIGYLNPDSRLTAPGTRRMIQVLGLVARDIDPRSNGFTHGAILGYLRQIQQPPDLRSQLRLRVQIAKALLDDGDTPAALEELQRLTASMTEHRKLFKPGEISGLKSLLAIAHLRLGEQQNCLAHHGIDSCLLPIRGTGVHRERQGAQAAVGLYLEILESEPEDLEAKWLLHIAAMSLGIYPDGVPERWRIPPERFEADADIGRFYDVAPARGVAVRGMAGGCVLEDMDGDGDLDLMASTWGLGPQDQIRYFRNEGAGRFVERTEAAGLGGLVGGLNMNHADHDNDGHPDVLVLRGGWLAASGRQPNSLLRNRGDGTFEDVTEAAGLLDFHPTQTAAWGDADNDGDLDLYVGNESTGQEVHRCQLFRNNGDGTFTDIAPSAGLAVTGYVKGVVWGDYDNDGWQDLYVSRLAGPNLLFRNEGPDGEGGLRFTERSAEAGVREPRDSFPAWFWDYDNDGWLDLFVSAYELDYFQMRLGPFVADYLGLPSTTDHPRLYRNRGDGSFAEVSREMRVDKVLYAMGANHGDLDNDGYLDFYLGTGSPDLRSLMPNRMFRNAGGRHFEDVTSSGGFGHLQKGHAVAFGDVDGDGDQDVYTVLGGAFAGDVYPNALFENPGHGNHWIVLRLEGVRSNRSAIGTRIRILAETSTGPREIHATVGTGGSFGSSSLQQEIGLGQSLRIRELEIWWPATGQRQVFADIGMDQVLHIREDSASPRPVPAAPGERRETE